MDELEVLEDVQEYTPKAYYSYNAGRWVGGVDNSGFDRCPDILSPEEVDSINRGGHGHYRDSDIQSALAAWRKRQEMAAILAEADEVDEDTIWLSR